MKTLGLVMLTWNDEEFLSESLASIVPFVDEALVIDQFSSDHTPRIVRQSGVKLIQVSGNFATRGEKWFRDLAAALCRTDWMMVIDADEVMSDGWQDYIRSFINTWGDVYGAVEVPFYHLIGSYEFHTPNSPLWRPAFVRRHPGLQGSPPKEGSFAHSNYYLSYKPNRIKYLDSRAKIFHLGYVQRDLMKRWRTNFGRNDYNQSPEEREANLARLESNPCLALPEVVPMTIPISEYPAVLQPRVGRTYVVDYDPAARRIRSRSVIDA
jgi:glycosyltransferase involved in cell wall biosynthesis